jgi:drug/metabolite transporter (DMT)-like permease
MAVAGGDAINRQARSAIALAGLGAMLFSAKAVVVKLCYRHGADTETVLALRMAFSVPFFWSAVWWQTSVRRPAPMERRDVATALLLGFVGYYIASYLDFLGLQYISAGLERIILYLSPTIVLVVSAVLLGKHIDRRQWLAMFVAYAGVLLVFLHDVRLEGQRATLGSSLVFMSALAYAIYLVHAGEVVQRVGSVRLVAFASGGATVLCVLQALIGNPRGLVSQSPEVYALSLLNGSLCTAVPMLLVMAAVKQVGPGLAAQAGVIGPVATLVLGWYFLGEPITALQLLGMVVVLVSIGILLSASRRPQARAAV